MVSEIAALCFGASAPHGLARFWAELLGRETAGDGTILVREDETGFRIRFFQTQVTKSAQNLMHFDLTSATLEDQQRTVTRVLGLGARHIEVGQRPEEGHVVLADPEGNEFCVLEPGNNFAAGCGFLGTLVCSGTQAVGYFWSGALGWPLVWDQDQQTAIRSPEGGPKICWGGPPVRPRAGANRLHFDLAPLPGIDQLAEVERLVFLGAEFVRTDRAAGGAVVMSDPDGNEFCLLSRELRDEILS